MFDLIWSLAADALSTPEGASVLCAALLVFATSILGIAISKQWYFLIVQAAVLCLTAFLLNPLADSTSQIDLKTKLSNLDTVSLLGSIQLALLAFGFIIQIKLLHCDDSQKRERWRIALALVSVAPQPIIALLLLLTEQSILVHVLNTRPERVSLYLGGSVTVLLLVAMGFALLLSSSLKQTFYGIFAFSSIAAVSLLLTIQTPLPEIPLDPLPKLPAGSWLMLPCILAIMSIGAFMNRRIQKRHYSKSLPAVGSTN